MAPVDPQASSSANPDTAKKDLSSWWKNFKRGGEKRRDDERGGKKLHGSGSFSSTANQK
jgi:hypothetical protein